MNVGSYLYSDHFPILIEALPQYIVPKQDPKEILIVWDDKYHEFKEALNYELNLQNSTNIETLIECIYRSAKTCKLATMKRLDGRAVFGPPWFTAECRQMKKSVNIELKLFRKNKSSSLRWSQYIQAKKRFKKTCKERKMQFYEQINHQLRNSKSSKDFYSALKLFWKKDKSPTVAQPPMNLSASFRSSSAAR